MKYASGSVIPKSYRNLKDLTDTNPEFNYPDPLKMPVGLKDAAHFQKTQLYLYKSVLRDKKYGKGEYQTGIVSKWQNLGQNLPNIKTTRNSRI